MTDKEIIDIAATYSNCKDGGLEGLPFVGLIKEHRERFRCSLYESKRALDRCVSRNDGKIVEVYSNQLLKTFNLYQNDLKDAVLHVMDHWQILGFKSQKHGIETILENF